MLYKVNCITARAAKINWYTGLLRHAGQAICTAVFIWSFLNNHEPLRFKSIHQKKISKKNVMSNKQFKKLKTWTDFNLK